MFMTKKQAVETAIQCVGMGHQGEKYQTNPQTEKNK